MDSEAYMILAVRNVYPSIGRVRGSTDGYEADGTFIRMDASLLTTELKRLGSDIVWTVGETLLNWDIQQYANDRMKEYPRTDDGDIDWENPDAIEAVKSKYPKPD